MKRLFVILFLFFFVIIVFANNNDKGDEPRTTPVEKKDANWSKTESDTPETTNTQVIADSITFSTNEKGILLTLPKVTNNVKLFALTGEAVWTGNLVQGRFFIPVRAGIYFLRINNKSYKVVCK